MKIPPPAHTPGAERLTSPDAAASVTVSQRPAGLSAEMRRFSAGIRAVVALLCTLLLVIQGNNSAHGVLTLLFAYCAWSGIVLWCEANSRPLGRSLLHFWIDVTWTVLVVQLTSSDRSLLAITLVQPIVLASVGFGVRSASLLSVYAALGLLANTDLLLHPNSLNGPFDPMRIIPALGVLALGPMAAMLAKPMNVLRERIDLVAQIEARLDPRRGLEALSATLTDGLRTGMRSDVAGIVLPMHTTTRAVLSTTDDGAFVTSTGVHTELCALLARLPHCPVSHVGRHWFGLRGGTRAHVNASTPAWKGDLRAPMAALAGLLQVRALMVVPLIRFGRIHGHLLIGTHDLRARMHEINALADAAPEFHRLVEQAVLVDQLQDESAAHERARIGRDLHDSAIQPYLGLKYAVESVALRMGADNPARADIEGLLDLVNGEVSELREIISGLRGGEPRGDNAFVPAVRRQVRRFSLLFGIDVELECPEQISTTRALAGALFHMVNEALNNVRKHTAATRVSIRIEEADTMIRLVVRDNSGAAQGRHPDPDFVPRSLSERSAALGGTLTVDTVDGKYTEVTISVPLSSRHSSS